MDRPLPLQRVSRLLRALQTSLSILSKQLQLDDQRAQDVYATLRSSSSRLNPVGGAVAHPVDDDWSLTSSKRKRSGGAAAAGRRPKRAARLSGGSSGAAAASLDRDGRPLPSSSPFKATRRQNGRTYGARAGRGEATGSTRASTSVSSAAPTNPLPQRPTASSRLSSSSSLDFSSRLSLSSPKLSSEAQRHTLHALKAFGNVLAVCGGNGATAVPSLGEIAAREVGYALEEEIEAALTDGMDGSRGQSGRGGETAGSEGEVEDVGLSSSSSDDDDEVVLGGRNRAEYDLERQRLTEEWYETVPEFARRWILSSHATSLVLRSLPEPAGTSAVLFELFFELCLSEEAVTEAARFHNALLASHLYATSHFSAPSSAAPSPLTLTTLLRLTPSPRSLISASVRPLLLSSSFSSRLFFSPFLALPRARGTLSADEGDARWVGTLLSVLGEVGGKMCTVIRAIAEELEAGEEDEGVEKLREEVLRRVDREARTALAFLLPLLFAKEGVEEGDEVGQELVGAVKEVEQALAAVLTASGGSESPAVLVGLDGADDDEPTSREDLLALLHLTQLALLALPSSSQILTPLPHPTPAGVQTALRTGTEKLLLPALARSQSCSTPASIVFRICDAALSLLTSQLSFSATVEILLTRLLAIKAQSSKREQRGRHADPTSQERAEAEARLKTLREVEAEADWVVPGSTPSRKRPRTRSPSRSWSPSSSAVPPHPRALPTPPALPSRPRLRGARHTSLSTSPADPSIPSTRTAPSPRQLASAAPQRLSSHYRQSPSPPHAPSPYPSAAPTRGGSVEVVDLRSPPPPPRAPSFAANNDDDADDLDLLASFRSPPAYLRRQSGTIPLRPTQQSQRPRIRPSPSPAPSAASTASRAYSPSASSTASSSSRRSTSRRSRATRSGSSRSSPPSEGTREEDTEAEESGRQESPRTGIAEESADSDEMDDDGFDLSFSFSRAVPASRPSPVRSKSMSRSASLPFLPSSFSDPSSASPGAPGRIVSTSLSPQKRGQKRRRRPVEVSDSEEEDELAL